MLAKPSPKRCRNCGTTDPRRFGALARTECRKCKAEQPRIERPEPGQAAPAARNQDRAPAHLAWVRGLRCATGCPPPCHAHHVRTGTGGGTGIKPADRWTVPLCARHHGELHQHGQLTFEARYRLDLKRLAAQIAARSPYLTRN